MRVNLIIPSFYPAFVYGGPIFSTYHACNELAKFDDVDIFVSTTNANMKSRLDVKINRWIRLNGFFVKYYNETIIEKLSLKLFLNVWRDIQASDLVHVQSIFNTPTPISLLYSKILKKKVLLSPRGSLGEWCLNNGSKLKLLWLKYAIRPFLENVVWHSTSLQEKGEILRVFPNACVEIIPNGIEYGRFQVSNELSKTNYIKRFVGIDSKAEKIVISMGRIEKKKGFDVLIQSFLSVLSRYPTAKLIIAGHDEGELTNLLSLIEKLKLGQSVFLIGSIAGQDKIDFLANADLFALPSHNENFGNVYIESLAAGTPIVASVNTPWAEVESAGCGKWVPNQVEDTSNAILEILSYDREIMRNNSKKHAEKYDWINVGVQFRSVYKKLVE
ncbi:glycosyltransferase [Vibrio caribbeanicus]|uniref:glycosyltransferase n=1 Tax=Vibrio caribbeanicus TaxID=701175 RepID=UPI0030DA92B3